MGLLVPSIYRHTQPTAAIVWTIVHNLGANGGSGIPVIDTFIEEGGNPFKVVPKYVEIVDANTVSVTFSVARSGFAIVIV